MWFKPNDYPIALAIRTGVTGFGNRPPSLRSERTTVVLRQDAVGPDGRGTARFARVPRIANGDGTATCEQDCLMWIQAPWGMQWEGEAGFLASLVSYHGWMRSAYLGAEYELGSRRKTISAFRQIRSALPKLALDTHGKLSSGVRSIRGLAPSHSC